MTSKLFFPLLLAASLVITNDYREGSTIGTVEHGPRQNNLAIYFNTNDALTLQTMSESQWHIVDVSAMVPPDTQAVFVNGLLVLTHGAAPGNCDMQLFFRRLGETYEPNYIGQITAGGVQETPRQTIFTIVPVEAGKFEFKWIRNTPGTWPEQCSYGVHLGVVGYVR